MEGGAPKNAPRASGGVSWRRGPPAPPTRPPTPGHTQGVDWPFGGGDRARPCPGRPALTARQGAAGHRWQAAAKETRGGAARRGTGLGRPRRGGCGRRCDLGCADVGVQGQMRPGDGVWEARGRGPWNDGGAGRRRDVLSGVLSLCPSPTRATPSDRPWTGPARPMAGLGDRMAGRYEGGWGGVGARWAHTDSPSVQERVRARARLGRNKNAESLSHTASLSPAPAPRPRSLPTHTPPRGRGSLPPWEKARRKRTHQLSLSLKAEPSPHTPLHHVSSPLTL